MSSVFRLEDFETIEVSTRWDFEQQIHEVTSWLSIPENAHIVRGSILDIGFNCRLCLEVAVQGETIPTEFMRLLASLDVTLWLSIYPPLQKSERRS